MFDFVPFCFQEMGFSREQADQAIQQYGTVQTALDALLSGVATDWKGMSNTHTHTNISLHCTKKPLSTR